MTKSELQNLLDEEVLVWSAKPRLALVEELGDGELNYEREARAGWHQFSITLLENTSDYVHVMVSVNDGSPRWAVCPLSSSFIVRHDGSIER